MIWCLEDVSELYRPLPQTYSKTNLKWTTELTHVRVRTVICLEDPIGVNPDELRLGARARTVTPKASVVGENLVRCTWSKFKISVLQKMPTRNWKGKPQAEKIFANHMFDMGLISRIEVLYIRLYYLKRQPNLKWTKYSSRDFFREGMWMASRRKERSRHHWSFGECRWNCGNIPLYTC